MHVTLILVASLSVTPTSPEPVIGVKPEILTFETLAHRLSQGDVQVRCVKSLADRHGLIALKPREWPQLRQALEKSLNIQFRLVQQNVWEMAPNPTYTAKQAALATQYFKAADEQTTRLLRKAFAQLPKPTLPAAADMAGHAQQELNLARGGNEAQDTELIRSLTETRDLYSSINSPTEWTLAQLQLSKPFIKSFASTSSRTLLLPMAETARVLGYGDRSEIDPGNFNLNWMLEATHFSVTAWPDLESGSISAVGVPLTSLGCYRPGGTVIGPSFSTHRARSPWDLLDKTAQDAHEARVKATVAFLRSDLAQRKVRLAKGSRVSVLTILKALAEQGKLDVVAECPPAMELAGVFVTSDFRVTSLHELLGPLLIEGQPTSWGPLSAIVGAGGERRLDLIRLEEKRTNSISLTLQDGIVVGGDELTWLRRTARPPVFALARWEEGVLGSSKQGAGVPLADVLGLVKAMTPEANADWFRLPLKLNSPTGLQLQPFSQSMPFWAILANLPEERLSEILLSISTSGEAQIPFSSLPQNARNAFLNHCDAIPTLRHIARHPNLRAILERGAVSFARQGLTPELKSVSELSFALYPAPGLQPAGNALAIEYGGVLLTGVEKL